MAFAKISVPSSWRATSANAEQASSALSRSALKDKDRGTEPHRPKKDYPWFWCEEEPGTDPKGGKDFVGNRWNDVHLTLETKQKARGE